MLLERAFQLIHNLDISEAKRKHFQQWATVVVDKKGEVIDVIKHFEEPSLSLNSKHMKLYPKSVQFTVKAGEMFISMEEFNVKIKDCINAHKYY